MPFVLEIPTTEDTKLNSGEPVKTRIGDTPVRLRKSNGFLRTKDNRGRKRRHKILNTEERSNSTIYSFAVDEDEARKFAQFGEAKIYTPSTLPEPGVYENGFANMTSKPSRAFFRDVVLATRSDLQEINDEVVFCVAAVQPPQPGAREEELGVILKCFDERLKAPIVVFCTRAHLVDQRVKIVEGAEISFGPEPDQIVHAVDNESKLPEPSEYHLLFVNTSKKQSKEFYADVVARSRTDLGDLEGVRFRIDSIDKNAQLLFPCEVPIDDDADSVFLECNDERIKRPLFINCSNLHLNDQNVQIVEGALLSFDGATA